MKPTHTLILALIVVLCPACSDTGREAQKAEEDAAAKARAEAAKKEMETLPKVFRSRDIFEKSEPAKSEAKSVDTTPAKSP